MTIIRQIANPSLKGHKLLAITPWDPPQDFLNNIHTRFPDLQVVFHKGGFVLHDWNEIPEDSRRDVTLLVTGVCLPPLEQAGKLQFVQIISAGANLILDKPVFKNTNIPFSTANGVHG